MPARTAGAEGVGRHAGMRTAAEIATVTMTSTAPITNAKRQLSAVAASPPTRRGAVIPPRLTATSPSVMATVRCPVCASESAAHSLIIAELPSRLTNSAATTVTATRSP